MHSSHNSCTDIFWFLFPFNDLARWWSSFYRGGIRVITCLVTGGRGDRGNHRDSSSSTPLPPPHSCRGGAELGAVGAVSWVWGVVSWVVAVAAEVGLRVGLSIMPVLSPRWGGCEWCQDPHLPTPALWFVCKWPGCLWALPGSSGVQGQPQRPLSGVSPKYSFWRSLWPNTKLCLGEGNEPVSHLTWTVLPSVLSTHGC